MLHSFAGSPAPSSRTNKYFSSPEKHFPSCRSFMTLAWWSCYRQGTTPIKIPALFRPSRCLYLRDPREGKQSSRRGETSAVIKKTRLLLLDINDNLFSDSWERYREGAPMSRLPMNNFKETMNSAISKSPLDFKWFHKVRWCAATDVWSFQSSISLSPGTLLAVFPFPLQDLCFTSVSLTDV